VKIGCIDVQRVIDKVAADKLLRNLLEDKKNDFLKKAETLAKDINALKETLSKEGSKLDSERVKAIKEDILFKEEELKNFVGEKSALLQQKEEALSYRVLQNIYDYVKDVAVKNGYSMILEKGTAVIYVDPEIDITDEVIKALDKERENVLKGGGKAK
jgi:outer membrane protein